MKTSEQSNKKVKEDLLTKSAFGSRIAEEEVDNLHKYFVKTEHWRKVKSGEVDIIFGAKGAGKSALYALLVSTREELRIDRRTIFLAAEKPLGTPAFRELINEPIISEDKFISLWKLYFLTLSASYLKYFLTANKIYDDEEANDLFSLLISNELLAPNSTFIARLKAVYGYIQRYFPVLEADVTDPNTGLKIKGKITLAEPSRQQHGLGFRSIDELMSTLNSAFQRYKITCWLLLDRLDVAFIDSPELESNALRSLFRAYLDMLGFDQIRLKIFLRDDIWKKIVEAGFREASHITRTLTLNWDSQSLSTLLVRRVASNVHICDFYGFVQDDLMNDAALQAKLFAQIFPAQIDAGPNKPTTLGWMLSRTADGTKRTAPRELIHLLIEARDEQLKRYQNGVDDSSGTILIDKMAIRNALTTVSQVRYVQTLCAEYPALKVFLTPLENGKTQHNIQTLSKLWKTNSAKTAEAAEKLVEAGFFEKRMSAGMPQYWVPFIYRDALSMVQGTSE